MTDTAVAEPTTTVPSGDSTTTYIPWGPGHPGWLPFWRHAHEIADEHEMCPEFDRMAEAVDGVRRPPSKQDVWVDVTLRVRRTVERDEDPDTYDLAQAIYDMDGSELRHAIQDTNEYRREDADE